MSQFVFGEVLLPGNKNILQLELKDIHDCPFELRFHLTQYDFYHRIAPLMYNVVPFVITDGRYDNTAELLLRSDSIVYENENLINCYEDLLSMSFAERVNLLTIALRDVLYKLDALECILILCDGSLPQSDFTICKVDDLAKIIKASIKSNAFYINAKYRIKK